MSTETLTTLITVLVFSITPLLAKIIGDFLRRRMRSNYVPIRVKVGPKNREFEFKMTKDLKEEDIERIVKYLTDIQEIERTPQNIASQPETVDVDEI